MPYNRISADCHIDLPWIPPDLFTGNASAAMKDRMPYVTDGPDGPFWTCKNGRSFGLVNGVGPAGREVRPGQHYRVDVMAATGLYEDGKKGVRRRDRPALRARDMERDGVDAEVIYGILGAATRLNDPEAANEMFHIYNDWLVEFCRPTPTATSGWRACPTATSTPRSRRSTAWQARPARHGAVVLVGHGADVASRSGSRSGRR